MKKSQLIISISLLVLFLLGVGLLVFKPFSSKEKMVSETSTSVSASSSEVGRTVQNTALELEGATVPTITVTDTEGNEMSLGDLVTEKPTLIVEWASWCPDCQRQLPIIQKVYEKYNEQVNFVLIDVTNSQKEPKEQAMAYIQEQGYTFPVYFDESQAAKNGLRVQTIPTLYLVNKNQVIQKVIIRHQEEADLEQELTSIL